MEFSLARAFTFSPCTTRPSALNRPHQRLLAAYPKLPFVPYRRALKRIAAARATAGGNALGNNVPTAEFTGLYKKVLLPIIDRNPYLSEATRQAAATTTSLAKKYGAEITVVVIDENSKESIADHDLRIKTIRWHLAQGGFEEFVLLESLGEGKLPAAIIGEIADDLSLDLVVMSMESIHSKHVDGNLLPEFVPCPIMLLPL